MTAFAGLRPEVVHICSALTYTLLVLLAAFVARGRARGAEGVIRALLAAGIMLAPQPTGPTQVLLGSPDHVGTAVPVLRPAAAARLGPGPAGTGRAAPGHPARRLDRRRSAHRGGRRAAALPRLPDPGRADPVGTAGRFAAPAASSGRSPRLAAWASRTGLVRAVARRPGGAGRPGRPPGLPADRVPGRLPHRQGFLRPAARA